MHLFISFLSQVTLVRLNLPNCIKVLKIFRKNATALTYSAHTAPRYSFCSPSCSRCSASLRSWEAGLGTRDCASGCTRSHRPTTLPTRSNRRPLWCKHRGVHRTGQPQLMTSSSSDRDHYSLLHLLFCSLSYCVFMDLTKKKKNFANV